MPRPLIRSRSRARPTAWMPESLRDAATRVVEIAGGGIIILLSLSLALAFLSYDTRDPSWNTAIGGSLGKIIHNWIGVIGSYSADFVWQFFGYGGFLIAIVLAAWGWRVASGRRLDLIVWRLLAALVAVLTFAIASSGFDFTSAPESLLSGGAFGKLLNTGILSYLPFMGSRYLVIVIMLVFSIGTLYMACALTFSEWHAVATSIQQAVFWFARRVHRSVMGLWHILRGEETGVVHDDLDDNEEEDTSEQDALDFEINDREEKLREAKKIVKAPLVKRPAASARQARLALHADGDISLPPLDLLQWPDSAKNTHTDISEEALEKNAKLLESVLADFGVNGTITKVSPGPVVTLYELEPSPGTRAARVVSLADDIARNMSATAVRVGRAVATVRVDAWQADPARPVAAGHGNFQLIAG